MCSMRSVPVYWTLFQYKNTPANSGGFLDDANGQLKSSGDDSSDVQHHVELLTNGPDRDVAVVHDSYGSDQKPVASDGVFPGRLVFRNAQILLPQEQNHVLYAHFYLHNELDTKYNYSDALSSYTMRELTIKIIFCRICN